MSNYRDARYPYSAAPRSSTNAVYETAFDARFGPAVRATGDYGRSRAGTRPYYSQASSRSTLDTSHPHASTHSIQASRPRRNSSTEPYGRASLSLIPPEGSAYNRPIIRTHDTPRSPQPKTYAPHDDKGGVLYPAVSSNRNHHRHNSSTMEDLSRLSLVEREGIERQRSHRNSYVARPRGYPSAVRSTEDEYSYTGPREQFERDYPAAQSRPRRDNYARNDRPVSMIDYDDYKTSQPSRREPPLSSVKHFDKLERNDLLRPGSRSGTTSEVERDNRRRDGGKKPVSIHQYERDEGYSSQRDDLNDRRGSRYDRPTYEDDRYLSDRERHHRSGHHERKHSRSHHERHESKDRSGINSVLAAAGLGVTSVAAAALKDKHDERGNKDKDKDYETDSRRSERDKRQQGRDTEFDMDRRDRRHDKPRSSEQTKEKSDSESGREKRHRRRRHRESVGAEIIDSESSIDKLNAATATAAGTAPVSTMTEEPKERHRHRHRHRRHRSRDHEAKEFRDDGNEMVGSPTDLRNEDSKELRPRKTVTLVEPQKNEAPEVKPKGILKPPRQAFPEDPNPTREGVAPLKDATKKGIPTGARWTKINRILVNPEALEASQERFEERDNYVIVLRVLSREEVQKLADKTREIREAREKVTDRKSDRSEEDDRNRSNRTSRDEDDDSVTDSDYSSSDSYFSDEEVHHPDDHRRNRPQAEEQRTERPLPLEAPPEQYLPSFPPPTSQPEAAFVPVPRPTQMNQLNMPPQHLQQPQQQQ